MLLRRISNSRSKNFTYQINNFIFLLKHHCKGLVFLKQLSSRRFGKRCLQSRGKLVHKQLFLSLNRSFTGFFIILLVYDIYVLSFRARYIIFSCLYGVFGYWFYFWYTSVFTYLGYLMKPDSIYFKMQEFSLKSLFCFTTLLMHSPYSSICLLGTLQNNTIKFVRSPGSFGILLSPRLILSYSLILLPSKKLKLFFMQTLAMLGRVMSIGVYSKLSSKAGFYKNRGCRPITRGTVKNANDHPNGGRRRSLSPSHTKWGFIAKNNK